MVVGLLYHEVEGTTSFRNYEITYQTTQQHFPGDLKPETLVV
jgi:hypothetical protein